MSANGLAAQAVDRLQADGKPQSTPANNALAVDSAISALSMYIPAEAMALYLAVMTALPDAIKSDPSFDPQWVYWGFVVGISPGLFLLSYFAKLAKDSSPLPKLREYPWFRTVASMIGFAAWGLCVPGATTSAYSPLYGILASFVSIALPSTEGIYNWVLASRNGQASPAGVAPIAAVPEPA